MEPCGVREMASGCVAKQGRPRSSALRLKCLLELSGSANSMLAARTYLSGDAGVVRRADGSDLRASLWPRADVSVRPSSKGVNGRHQLNESAGRWAGLRDGRLG